MSDMSGLPNMDNVPAGGTYENPFRKIIQQKEGLQEAKRIDNKGDALLYLSLKGNNYFRWLLFIILKNV